MRAPLEGGGVPKLWGIGRTLGYTDLPTHPDLHIPPLPIIKPRAVKNANIPKVCIPIPACSIVLYMYYVLCFNGVVCVCVSVGRLSLRLGVWAELVFASTWPMARSHTSPQRFSIVNLMGYALCRRPPTIAHCSGVAVSWHCCKRILAFLVRKLVIQHDWWLHFGVLGGPGPFLEHWGTQ